MSGLHFRCHFFNVGAATSSLESRCSQVVVSYVSMCPCAKSFIHSRASRLNLMLLPKHSTSDLVEPQTLMNTARFQTITWYVLALLVAPTKQLWYSQIE